MKMKKVGRFFLVVFVFLFILSLLAWSVPVLGAQEEKINEETTLKIEDLKAVVFEKEKTTAFDLGVSEPSGLISFLGIWRENIQRFFSPGYFKKIELSIKSASRRLLEARASVFIDSLESKNSIKALDRYRKATKSARSQFFDLLSSIDFSSKDEKLFTFLTDSFIGWQRILGEIAYKSQDQETKELAREIFKENIDVFPQFMAGFGGGESLAIRLSDSFDKDRSGFFENFLNLFILTSLKRNSSRYGGFQFWLLTQKIRGRTLSEFSRNYQAFREEINIIFNLTPFIDIEVKNNTIEDLIQNNNQNEIFSKLNSFFDSTSQEDDNLKICSEENIIRNQSRLKELEDASISSNYPNWFEIELKEFEKISDQSQKEAEKENWKKSCRLSKEANRIYEAMNQSMFFRDNPDKAIFVVNNLKKTLDEGITKLEDYNKEEYIRVFELADILENQFKQIKLPSDNESYNHFLKEIVQFWRRLTDFEKALQSKNLHLFSSQKKEDFSRWCWLERGRLINDISIWPECILPGGEPISLIELNNF